MRWFWVFALAACSYKPGASNIDPNDDSGVGDAPPLEAGTDVLVDAPADAPVDAPEAAACFGSVVRICLPAPLPTANFQLDSGNTKVVNTDATVDCVALAEGTSVNACVLAGRGVQIDGTLVATGSRPLVLLATEDQINVNGNGTIDVASKVDRAAPGAGARLSCSGGTAPSGAGGGAGGSYGGAGGAGGSATLSTGGMAGGPSALIVLAGGCPGQAGGNAAGTGGAGGGAVALVAESAIIVDGLVNASGAGGKGAPASVTEVRGGGGGGSGGAIVLDAPMITINGNGKLLAQGGGGGEGNSTAADGDDGDDPNDPGTAASGGNEGSGGDGGPGATGSGGSAGSSAGGTNGGGGGGGGTGYNARRASAQVNVNTSDVSPPLTIAN